MPQANSEYCVENSPPTTPQKVLPFPPPKRSQILHCSYHYWHPIYRSVTPKARLIPLTDPFLNYLRADSIFLPPDGNRSALADDDSGIYSGSDSDDGAADPSTGWQEIHAQIKATISELGGKVTPKLNWSAPKDATWISATNDMVCRSANDVYLLLKSSDFVTHDLEHAFDGCIPDEEQHAPVVLPCRLTDGQQGQSENPQLFEGIAELEIPHAMSQNVIPYHLVLRKYINLNPSLEFRCFVRNRHLLCLCQRDLNHFDFLFGMRDVLCKKILLFFNNRLRDSFPDANFVFDVYVPPPHDRVWLIDINPWAPRTDPLLFSWLEVLEMKGPDGSDGEAGGEGRGNQQDILNLTFIPEFRLVERDDPEAYGFITPQYSAHKLPQEVVDASWNGSSGLREFLGQWQDVLAKKIEEDEMAESDGD